MSDECATNLLNSEEYVVFSSREHLIAEPALRVVVWLLGIPAFLGNIVSAILFTVRHGGRYFKELWSLCSIMQYCSLIRRFRQPL